MKLTILRDTLLSLARQCHLRGGPVGNPRLGLVAMTATKILKPGAPDSLALRASIGLVSIDVMGACTVEEEGEVAIDCKALKEQVAAMPPSGELRLELKKSKLIITSGERKWTAATQPAEQVIVLPTPKEDARSLILPAAELLTMIDRVKFCVSNVPGDKPSRQGIYVDVLDQVPSVVVWGNHVNVVCTPKPAPALRVNASRFQLLLTPLVIERLRELTLEKDSPEVELRYDDSSHAWLVSSSSLVCFIPPIERFVDWRELMTHVSYTPVCRLPRLAILQSLSALIAAADEYAQATCTLDPKLGKFCLEHKAGARKAGAEGTTDHFEDRVQVTDITSPEMPRFYVNAEYLRDAIDAAGEDVVLNFEQSGGAIVLTTDSGYECFVTLVSPP